MISISTTTSNPSGNIVLRHHYGSKLHEKPLRVSRTKTLDGGVYINHSGYTDGDRTLSINATITKDQETIINSIAALYTSFLFGLDDGVYLGSISSFTAENGKLKMTVYLEQKET
jgi:hypothetical protein